MGSLYGSLKGVLSNEKYRRRTLTAEVRSDLTVWQNFLETAVRKPFRMLRKSDRPHFTLSTDACTSVGYGCVFGERWFGGLWPSEKWRSLNITLLELFPVFVALHLWRETLSNRVVRVLTDNQALVAILNKLYCKEL